MDDLCRHGEYFVFCEPCAPCSAHEIHDCDECNHDFSVGDKDEAQDRDDN